MNQRALNKTVSSDHPANSPAAETMRDVEVVSRVLWCYGTTFRLRFDPAATAEQMENLLDAIEAACGLTPTDDQPRGRAVVVQREFVDIEIEAEE